MSHDLLVKQSKATDALLNMDDSMQFGSQWLQLLRRRALLYTTGDSSSLPVETMNQLAESLNFSLNLYMKSHRLEPRALVGMDIHLIFTQALKEIQEQMAISKKLFQAVVNLSPPIENLSLTATMKGIHSFFKKYDAQFFAHQVPADIDYQLAFPVPEQIQGIEFIHSYLKHLAIEHLFVQRFGTPLVIRILELYCPDYRGLLINLYEPVLTNALGRMLLGKDPLELNLSKVDQMLLTELFDPLGSKQVFETLTQVAKDLAFHLGLFEAPTIEYIQRTAVNLGPRISAARECGSLHRIFLSFDDPNPKYFD